MGKKKRFVRKIVRSDDAIKGVLVLFWMMIIPFLILMIINTINGLELSLEKINFERVKFLTDNISFTDWCNILYSYYLSSGFVIGISLFFLYIFIPEKVYYEEE